MAFHTDYRQTKVTFYNLPIIKGSKFNHYWNMKYKVPFKFDPFFEVSIYLTPRAIINISSLVIILNADKDSSLLPFFIGGIASKLEYDGHMLEYFTETR